MKRYKGYQEMTRCVLAARDAHLEKKRRQQRIILRCVPVMSCLCIAMRLGFGFWTHLRNIPAIGSVPPIAEVTTVPEQTAIHIAEKTTARRETGKSSATTPTTAETMPDNPQKQISASGMTEAAYSEPTAEQTDITSEPGKTAETEPVTGQTSDAPSGQTAGTTDDRSSCADNHTYLHWDEMTVDQQYFMAEIGEPPLSYHTAERKISADEIGAYIGQAYMSGYDWYEMIYYHCEAKAYRIKGDDAGRTIVIQFPDDETYYLYSQDVQPLLEQPTG